MTFCCSMQVPCISKHACYALIVLSCKTDLLLCKLRETLGHHSWGQHNSVLFMAENALCDKHHMTVQSTAVPQRTTKQKATSATAQYSKMLFARLTWKCRMISLLSSAGKYCCMSAQESLPRGSKPPSVLTSMMTGTVAV